MGTQKKAGKAGARSVSKRAPRTTKERARAQHADSQGDALSPEQERRIQKMLDEINAGIEPVRHELAGQLNEGNYIDRWWEKSPLSRFLAHSLGDAHRACRGLDAVMALLTKDEELSADRDDNSNQVSYIGLGGCIRSGLLDAQRALLREVSSQLDSIVERVMEGKPL